MNTMRPQMVLFGDSITQESFRPGGWGASLTDTYSRKADIVVRGFDGYNTRWAHFLLHHIFPLDSAKRPPAATTVFFGANDAALVGGNLHVPVEEYTQNLTNIVHHLKECSPTMLIVLITPPPIDEEVRIHYVRSLCGGKDGQEVMPDRTNDMTGIYAQACIEVAKELGVCSIDLWSRMQQTEGWQNKYLSDGLHLTQEGNGVVYREVIKVFNKASSLSAEEMPLDFPDHSQINPENPAKTFSCLCHTI